MDGEAILEVTVNPDKKGGSEKEKINSGTTDSSAPETPVEENSNGQGENLSEEGANPDDFEDEEGDEEEDSDDFEDEDHEEDSEVVKCEVVE